MVLFGQKAAVWLYGVSMMMAYLIVIVTPILKITTPWLFLSLITLPWFIKAFSILYRNFRNPLKMSPANMLTIRIHNVTGILLITGYLIDGMLSGQKVSSILGAVIVLIVLYLPVVLMVFIPRIPIKPAAKYLNQN